MVSIRLVALTAWLLMLSISFVFGFSPTSEVDWHVKENIKDGLKRFRRNYYANQRLYFCIIWQHFPEYFADGNFPVLNFLEDLHLTPSRAGVPVDLATLRTSLRQWIPQYRRGGAICPDVNHYIKQVVDLNGNLARFMNANQHEASYGTLIDGLKQDYERYSQAQGARAKLNLVGADASGGLPFTRFAQLARARFIVTILKTFDTMVKSIGALGEDAQLSHAQVNSAVAALKADPALRQQHLRQIRRRGPYGPRQQVAGQPRQGGSPPRRGDGHQHRRNSPRQD